MHVNLEYPSTPAFLEIAGESPSRLGQRPPSGKDNRGHGHNRLLIVHGRVTGFIFAGSEDNKATLPRLKEFSRSNRGSFIVLHNGLVGSTVTP